MKVKMKKEDEDDEDDEEEKRMKNKRIVPYQVNSTFCLFEILVLKGWWKNDLKILRQNFY